MIVYILGERGSETPIKVTTIQIYTEMYPLGKELIRRWGEVSGHRGSHFTLEKFITSQREFSLYFNELNEQQKPRRTDRKNIWKAMQREPGLEKEITKAMLRS